MFPAVKLMARLNRRICLVGIALGLTLLAGEALVAQSTPSTNVDLRQYEGHYTYRDDLTLYLVAHRDRLVAVLGDGKYPLRRVAPDTFENGVGDRIPILRDADGRVVAFQERGDTFRRLVATVPAEVRNFFEPRAGVTSYRYAAPAFVDDGIPVKAAGTGTLSIAVAEQLVQGVIDGRYADVRSMLVFHRGALRLEEYFYGYDRTRPHPMRSLTKSVISLLAGIAVDRRAVRADEPIWEHLGVTPRANPDPRKARVTLRDLLANESGFACDDHDGASPGNETTLYDTSDWVQAFADLPVVATPGTLGRYCSFGFKTAGRLVERTVGQPLAEFAQQALFDPLGIRRADWRWTFTLDRSQRNEFGQVYLRPRDMLKLGMLVQQRGEWAGRRVISAEWVDQATARQSHVDDSDYGLGIWHRWYNVRTASGEQRVNTIMMSGNGGQKVFLVPSLDLIAVFTGGSFNAESPTNEMMARVLLPALMP
jgi:CubicO group peptidase (beta-lactamase class C family)